MGPFDLGVIFPYVRCSVLTAKTTGIGARAGRIRRGLEPGITLVEASLARFPAGSPR
jgi:hypothetical protein